VAESYEVGNQARVGAFIDNKPHTAARGHCRSSFAWA
jgi:hypothetical protein